MLGHYSFTFSEAHAFDFSKDFAHWIGCDASQHKTPIIDMTNREQPQNGKKICDDLSSSQPPPSSSLSSGRLMHIQLNIILNQITTNERILLACDRPCLVCCTVLSMRMSHKSDGAPLQWRIQKSKRIVSIGNRIIVIKYSKSVWKLNAAAKKWHISPINHYHLSLKSRVKVTWMSMMLFSFYIIIYLSVLPFMEILPHLFLFRTDCSGCKQRVCCSLCNAKNVMNSLFLSLGWRV